MGKGKEMIGLGLLTLTFVACNGDEGVSIGTRVNEILQDPPGTRTAEARTPTPPPTATEIPTPTETPTPTNTPTPTSTPTSTPTETPTPDYMATNESMMETARDGETIVFDNITIDKVIIYNFPVFGEFIYGVIVDEAGNTAQLIENFNCQYNSLRENGQLGDLVDESAIRKTWEPNVTFEHITAQKNSQYGTVELFTSESYELEGEVVECAEEPLLGPAEQAARRIAEQVIDYVNEQRQR